MIDARCYTRITRTTRITSDFLPKHFHNQVIFDYLLYCIDIILRFHALQILLSFNSVNINIANTYIASIDYTVSLILLILVLLLLLSISLQYKLVVKCQLFDCCVISCQYKFFDMVVLGLPMICIAVGRRCRQKSRHIVKIIANLLPTGT